VLLGDRTGDRLDVRLDYVLRAYRDSRLGRWLFGDGARVFRTEGIDVVTAQGGNDAHRSYLGRIGFDYDRDLDRFVRRL
jgi:hypothetical protein